MKTFEWRAVRMLFAASAGLAFLAAGCESDDDDDGAGGGVVVVTNVVDGGTVVITNVAADVVHSAGNATVKGTFSFDFDNGSGGTTAVPAGDVADMFWNRLTPTDSQLVSRNGAKFAAMGVVDFGAVTKAQVQSLALSGAAIAHPALPAGTVVAFKTDAGRFGKFKVNGFSGNQDMALSWLTWD
ncbi:MAG TPA: hypothetical protein P5204_00355 [Kiritimatiellia bacterium]|nr:hypothetical protein [Kiritimatiellia bacterium]